MQQTVICTKAYGRKVMGYQTSLNVTFRTSARHSKLLSPSKNLSNDIANGAQSP